MCCLVSQLIRSQIKMQSYEVFPITEAQHTNTGGLYLRPVAGEGLRLLRREDETLDADRWRGVGECQQLRPELTLNQGGSEILRCRCEWEVSSLYVSF